MFTFKIKVKLQSNMSVDMAKNNPSLAKDPLASSQPCVSLLHQWLQNQQINEASTELLFPFPNPTSDTLLK